VMVKTLAPTETPEINAKNIFTLWKYFACTSRDQD
jgi:hypothetical protein